MSTPDGWRSPAHRPPRWRAQLDGERDELAALARLFAAGAVRVVEDGGRYYLTADEVQGLDDASAVRARLEVWTTRLNATGFLRFNGFRSVQMGTLLEARGTGENVFVSPAPAVLVLPSPALRTFLGLTPNRMPIFGPPLPIRVEDLPAVEEWVGVADRLGDVDVALRMLIAAPNDWRQLYYVYEIVEADVGGLTALAHRGLAILAKVHARLGCADFAEEFRLMGSGAGWDCIATNRADWKRDCLDAFDAAVAEAQRRFEIDG